MLLKVLDQCHPEYDAQEWCELEALAEGGKKFEALLEAFLPRHPGEPLPTYYARKQRAHYKSYMAAIISLYTSWLFAADFHVKSYAKGSNQSKPATADPFYGEFQEDVTGSETTLSAFVRERFSQTLKTGKSYWLCEKPTAPEGMDVRSKKESEDFGLDRVTLKALPRFEVKNWDCDDKGRLLWVVVHTVSEPVSSWEDLRGEKVLETWRIYTADSVITYTYEWLRSKGRGDAGKMMATLSGPARPHGFKRVPIVCLDVPSEACIGTQTKSPQIEHFQLDHALTWSLNRTAYAMPVVKIADDEKFTQQMGAGYFIQLGPEDDIKYLSPPSDSFEVLRKNRDNKREEIYRVSHQMAQAVDNNAETVGRSADSKEIDTAAMRMMLLAYGVWLAEAIEETYEIVSESRAEGHIEWSVEGFTGYDTATVASLIAQAKEARLLGIPSETFQKELTGKVAMSMLSEVDPKVKDRIRDEINSAKFEVSSVPAELQTPELDAAKAEFERAKAKSEPEKVKAAKKAAERPAPAPMAPKKGDSGPPR